MRIPFIIGEAGSCHEESEERAHALLDVAVQAGCDAVKFQYWSSPERMRERRHIPDIAHYKTLGKPIPYETGSIKAEWFPRLREQTKAKGILLACTVYLPEDVRLVCESVNIVKISSFEARDRDLTSLVVKHSNPVFISTGMFTEHELSYLPKRAIRMHCVSAYPCPTAAANLGAIERGQGYSDHTRSEYMGAFAVCAGANFLEVHFGLDDTSSSCPDTIVSHGPEALARYVLLARGAMSARGDGRKVPQEVERGNMGYRVIR